MQHRRARFDLGGPPLDLCEPGLSGIGVAVAIETAKEIVGEFGPVLCGQGKRLIEDGGTRAHDRIVPARRVFASDTRPEQGKNPNSFQPVSESLPSKRQQETPAHNNACLLYTSDAADE